jgi:hypothetical protein
MLKETDICFQEPVLSLDYVLNPTMGPRTQTPEIGWEIQVVENDFIKVFQLCFRASNPLPAGLIILRGKTVKVCSQCAGTPTTAS